MRNYELSTIRWKLKLRTAFYFFEYFASISQNTPVTKNNHPSHQPTTPVYLQVVITVIVE